MTTRIPRNAKRVYYATETVTRDGRRFAGREQSPRRSARPAPSFRHEDGSWTRLDRFTGNWEPMK